MDSFDYVAWIKYRESLQTDFISQINESPKFDGTPDQQFNQIIGYLDNLKGRKLLVLDNFDNPSAKDETKIKNILSDFKILITSRNQFDDIQDIFLKELSKEDAIKLFEKHYTKEYNLNELEQLLDQISYHTLLIELSAKVLKNSRVASISSVLESFKNRNLETIKTKINFREKKNKPALQHKK